MSVVYINFGSQENPLTQTGLIPKFENSDLKIKFSAIQIDQNIQKLKVYNLKMQSILNILKSSEFKYNIQEKFKPGQNEIVTIKNTDLAYISSEEFDQFIQFLYSGNLTVKDQNLAQQTLYDQNFRFLACSIYFRVNKFFENMEIQALLQQIKDQRCCFFILIQCLNNYQYVKDKNILQDFIERVNSQFGLNLLLLEKDRLVDVARLKFFNQQTFGMYVQLITKSYQNTFLNNQSYCKIVETFFKNQQIADINQKDQMRDDMILRLIREGINHHNFHQFIGYFAPQTQSNLLKEIQNFANIKKKELDNKLLEVERKYKSVQDKNQGIKNLIQEQQTKLKIETLLKVGTYSYKKLEDFKKCRPKVNRMDYEKVPQELKTQ